MSEPGSETPTLTDPGPVAPSERIHSLDVLRGFALLGILLVNMQSFGQPFSQFMNQHPEYPGLGMATWYFVRSLCELKFVTIFSFLFGVGFAIQKTRADAKGRSFLATTTRRILVLGAIGLFHALFLWYGDILFIYAYCAIPLMLMMGLSDRALSIAGWVLTILSLGFMCLLIGASTLFPQPESQDTASPDLAAFNESPFEYIFNQAQSEPSERFWNELETSATGEGPFWSAFAMRTCLWGMLSIMALFFFSHRVLGVFLIGAAVLRWGWFDPSRAPTWRRVAAWGLGIGIPLEIASAILNGIAESETTAAGATSLILHSIASLPLAAGYIGIVVLLALGGGRIAGWLASAGRWALTCYLGQTILATLVFNWWGFGQFAQWSHPALVALAFGIFALEVVLCRIGARFLATGPCEWAWRSLTYLRLQPLRRVANRPPMG